MSVLGGFKTLSSTEPTKVILFATDYDFLPEGVQRIRRIFDKKLSVEGLPAKFEYQRGTHTFNITCQSEKFQSVLEIFHHIVTGLIEEEVGDGYDELKSNLIARINCHPDEFEGSTESDQASEAVPELLSPQEVKVDWQCHTTDLVIDKILPRTAQAQIELLTGTQLCEDLNRQVIQVIAPSQEACDQAVHKLDMLRKYHDLAYSKIYHIFYTEEKEIYQLSIKPLLEVKKRLVETTLLDPVFDTWRYDQLNRTHTIRCCLYEHICTKYMLKSGQKLIPVVPEKDKDRGFDLWAGYVYRCRGNLSPKHRSAGEPRAASVGPLERAQNIRSWLVTATQGNPNEMLERRVENTPRVERSESSSFTGPVNIEEPQKQTSSTAAELKESEEDETRNDNVIGLSIAQENMDFLGIPPGRQLALRKFATPCAENGNSPSSEHPGESSSSQSLLDTDILEDLSARPPTQQSSSANNAIIDHGLEFFLNPYCSQSLLDNDILESDRRKLATKRFEVLKLENNGEASQPGQLLSPTTIYPTIYRETELESRIFHETMRQAASKKVTRTPKLPAPSRAPKKDKGKGKPHPSPPAPFVAKNTAPPIIQSRFIPQVGDSLKPILASIRNWQGEINLEAQFGRVLIKPFHPTLTASNERPLSHAPEVVSELLHRYPTHVGFTKIISTLPADIQFFLDMKADNNQKLWGEAVNWTVTYEYICCDHEDYDGNCAPGFVIEIDADSFETKVKSFPLKFGDVYVHCTMRNWDYCVSATGSRNLEEDYGGLVKEIANSTYIAPNLKEISMSFELSEKHAIHFLSIRVRRHSQYPGLDNKALLNITEVHDLDINWEQAENKIAFSAASSNGKSKDGQLVEPMWYEMSITSAEAQEAFKENISLEFGEETEWSEDNLLENLAVLKDMCEPANLLVKKMDGLGFYNDNGMCKAIPADVESLGSKRPSSKKSSYEYW